MPITSRIAAPRRCAWSARATPNLFASISAGICAPVGPAARRGQSGLRRNARADSRRRGQRQEICRTGQAKGQRLPPDGLRPSRLQELRSAGRRSSKPPATSCSRSARSTTRFSISPRNSRKRPSPIPISSSESCIRTSISTRASSTGRWAFRCRCSRCCSRWAGCPAGSPIGWKCTIRRRSTSAARGKSTPAPPSAKYVPRSRADDSRHSRLARSVSEGEPALARSFADASG